jgi:hypothetical protein
MNDSGPVGHSTLIGCSGMILLAVSTLGGALAVLALTLLP